MTRILAGLLISLVFAACARAGDNWPQWRGPAFDGTSDSTNLPTSWSADKNIRWKAPLPSWGAATPAVWGERIFVTSGSAADGGPEAGSKAAGPKLEKEGRDLLLLCLSRKDGSEHWRRTLDNHNQHNNKQNMASPSPCTDGKTVWAMTGTGVLTAFDFEGEVLWRRELQKDYGPLRQWYGYASSPLLWKDKLIIQVLDSNEKENTGYVLALDARTGEKLWKVARPTEAEEESLHAYTSPMPLTYADRSEIIVGGADYITAYDPANGQETWRCGGLNPEHNNRYRAVASPVVAAGMVFMAIRQGPTVACKGGGEGNVTATRTAWTNPAASDVPTPVSDGKYLYILHDNGMLTCLDAKTGQAKYEKSRLPSGTYSASPLLADGKLYLTSERARTAVVTAGPEFKLLGENKLEDTHTLSSIAVAGRELFIRTAKALYCISESPAP